MVDIVILPTAVRQIMAHFHCKTLPFHILMSQHSQWNYDDHTGGFQIHSKEPWWIKMMQEPCAMVMLEKTAKRPFFLALPKYFILQSFIGPF
jgi:hypothetical protein